MINSNIIHAGNAYIASQFRARSSPGRETDEKYPAPFVTISRQAGAGGTSVGQQLVAYLNENDLSNNIKWTLYDKNLIEKVIEEHHLPDTFRTFLKEEKISEIQNTFETLMGVHPGISMLAAKTCHTIIKLASVGNVVIIGRGANIITRNLAGGFHVRLICDMEKKIRNIESFFEMNRKEASRYIEEEDIRRKEYVKKLFNKNIEDPLLYDIVLNTGRISFETAAEIICNRVLSFSQHQRVHM